ncbi:uncharacterized protein HD556DRAFT_1531981 [Suillus plorans]|uniref:Uncharacterized protein n=1 Tax=Suillus plorans TaxID=116603 RepID=A0A9P7A8U0_9AGAM|nr:uncharacterized protein HD556DRAFT_1531981 [Suillus plorans]KAG1784538.1 hypothetical protein HD556DRAFT_1531981 [Suillus plorans]
MVSTEKCLRETGVDGVRGTYTTVPRAHPPHADLALEHLATVKSLKTRTSTSTVRGHLFKIMDPISEQADRSEGDIGTDQRSNVVEEYIEVAKKMEECMKRDAAEAMKRDK